jgi:hypothetical protein
MSNAIAIDIKLIWK